MTFFGMALLTGVGTVVLAVFAIVTAWYARKAFLKQSEEVRAIESQVADGQQLTRQQGELIKIQSEQVTVLRQQVAAQQEATARQETALNVQAGVLEKQLVAQEKAAADQGVVLKLQADELRESLAERKSEAVGSRQRQAAAVSAWFGEEPYVLDAPSRGAEIRNASELPVFDIRVFFHLINRVDGGGWVPVSVGGPPPSDTIPILAPNNSRFIEIPSNVRAMFGSIDISTATCVTSLEFTDAAGNKWERDPRGALKLLS